MNEAKTQLDAGNLNGAIEAALQAVKSNPTDTGARTFLFELSCFAGNWARAEKQLDVVGHQDAATMIGTLIYRQALEAEKKRERCFSDGVKPEFLADPPDYVYGLLTANNRLREGNTAEARDILDKIEEERPAFAAKINGAQVEDFRDYNDATSCILEAIIKDSYFWIPFEQIVKIEFTAPKSLRDLFWIQAKLETLNGANGEALVPSLYANSHRSNNDQIRLGRMTDWHDAGADIFIGEGLKNFWAGGTDLPVLEVKEIKMIQAE
ncbi:MAG: type VI secretion system accessory protein TagJ [Pyrinomonadaceae bacterium]